MTQHRTDDCQICKPECFYRGIHFYRCSNNPLERQFAEAWLSESQRPFDGDHDLLDHLLGDGMKPIQSSDRDRLVAATVIQWLGSQVGQNFLRIAMSEVRLERE